MKRWPNYREDCNTKEYWDKVWFEGRSMHLSFDAGRPAETCQRIKDGDKVIDLGGGMFGPGQWLLEKTEIDADVYIIDYSQSAIDWLSGRLATDKRANFYRCRAEATPYINNCFDVVISGELIEHYEDPSLLVKEMFRICKNDGWIVISTVDMHCSDAKRNGIIYTEHVWDLTTQDLLDLFCKCGQSRCWRFGNYYMLECRVNKYEENQN